MLLTPRRASKATPSIGFTFTRDRVDSVVRGSAVHRAGVVPGDRIVDLRGTRLDALDFTAECDLRARLASERFTATFIHAGKRVRVTVTPAPLF
jgi:predicted metalloprotease with PDZ domain